MPVYRRKWKDPQTGEDRLGHYYYKFVVEGVTYKATVKTAQTKKQAEEAERRARQDVHDGVYGHGGKRQLFSEFVREVYIPHIEQHHRRPDCTRQRAEFLCQYFSGLTLSQISQLSVERLKLEYARGVVRKTGRPRKPRTVNFVLTTLSGIFTLAVKHKAVRENPCRQVKRLAVEELPVRRLEPGEEEALLEAAASVTAYIGPMIRLALWTGMRQGELIALTLSSVDFGRNRLYVSNPKWRRDPRKTEGNPMGGEVRELLEELCREAGEYLFTTGDGLRLTRSQVDRAFRRACRLAGVTGFRFHDLRHEYGSRLGDADVNLKKIARLMGHSTTKMTERYVHPDEAGLLAATEAAAGGRPRIVPGRLREAGKGGG
jgi:integrase